MLKGHVFSKQLFENPVFAAFINTFLNGTDGVSNNFKNGMQITYSGSTLNVDSGLVCIQGRFIEEDTSTEVPAGNDNSYCKLVIEIDLDKENTESELNQVAYKIVKSSTGYPNLTQSNIVKNVSGIYQYELARFRNGLNGISDFQDMRTFLDMQSIYNQITTEYQAVLEQLEAELSDVKDGSAYLLKSGGKITGNLNIDGEFYISGKILRKTVYSENNEYKQSTKFIFERSGNLVNVKAYVTVKKGAPESPTFFKYASIESDSFGAFGYFDIPEWAKTKESVEPNEEILNLAFITSYSSKNEAIRAHFRKVVNEKGEYYLFMGTIEYDETSTIDDNISEQQFSFSYFVE